MDAITVVVLVKPVPDPRKSRGSAVIDPERKTVRRQGVPLAVDPACRYALEAAAALKGKGAGRVVAVGMGPPEAEAVMREALALGADEAYLLSDRALAGSDALATARALAAAARKAGFDLILAGSESSDAGTGQVGPTLAALLGLPHLPHCRSVGLQAADETKPLVAECRLGGEPVRARAGLPAAATFDRLDRPPKPAGFAGVVAARSKPFAVWGLGDLGLDPASVGQAGSPTVVREVRPAEVRSRAVLLEGDLEKVADRLLAILAEKGVV
ncbi:MAG: electron transfer flavoprotein subunit beta/FixA family protein [Bacillota bacterium]